MAGKLASPRPCRGEAGEDRVMKKARFTAVARKLS